MPDFRILFLLFLIYSAVGWLCESVYCSVPAHKFINRGFLNGPLCPIYGVGALLADALLTPAAWSLPLLFLGGAIVTSVLEYFTGWLLETLFHAKWWDYSDKKWNLHGRVCLRNSILFGLMCVILLRVLHPLLLGLVLRIPDPALTVLCAVLAAAFLADLVFSVRGALQLRGKLEALQEILDELRERTETALEEQKTAVRAAPSARGSRGPRRAGRKPWSVCGSGRPGWRAACALRTEDCSPLSRPCARAAVARPLSACARLLRPDARSFAAAAAERNKPALFNRHRNDGELRKKVWHKKDFQFRQDMLYYYIVQSP